MTHTSTEQPEALMRLADNYAEACFDQGLNQRTTDDKPETEREKLEKAIRRMHTRIAELEDVADMAIKHISELEAQLSAIGAGGVEPLRKRAGQQEAHPAEVAQASVLNGTLAAHVMLPCVERIDVLEVAKELKENISAFGDTKGKAKERAAFYLVSQHEQLLYWQQQVRQLLAAAKVELKPLTDEAIRTLYGESDGHWQMVGPQVLCFARSIESAHGIQEQTT